MTTFGLRNNAARKLTAYEVAEMRKSYAEGATQGALARSYGVSVGQVGRIVRGESWQAGPVAQRGQVAAASVVGTTPPPGFLEELVAMQVRRGGPPVSLLDGGDGGVEEGNGGLDSLQAMAKEFKEAK